jgi:hypothetical protein
MYTANLKSHKQTGSALVVGLILLVAITLMAVSTMGTASLDLMMSGNEQYRLRSFQAAETGIQTALINDAVFNTGANYSLPTPSFITSSGNDKFTFAVTRPTNGIPSPPPAGTSEGAFAAYYFRIASTGFSERGAIAVNTQEVYEVVKAASEFTCNSTWTCGL